jgi:hypothetical protein
MELQVAGRSVKPRAVPAHRNAVAAPVSVLVGNGRNRRAELVGGGKLPVPIDPEFPIP